MQWTGTKIGFMELHARLLLLALRMERLQAHERLERAKALIAARGTHG